MEKETAPLGKPRFPLTEFMLALIRMTPEQRARASAEKAAERYNLSVGTCQYYIDHWRRTT